MFNVRITAPLAVAMSLALSSFGSAATISPLPDTQDAWVYGFLSTSSSATLSGFFPGIIAVANDSPHSINSFVEFGNLGTTGLTSSQVASATLTLTVGPNVGFGPNPTPSAPVTVDLYAAGSAWDTSVTWGTQPSATAQGLIGQVSDDGSLSTISFNVTSLVQSWLAGSATNNGFILTQDNAGTQSLTFDALSNGSNVPTLSIVTTPEPTSLVLALLAAGVAGLWHGVARRRKVKAN